MDKRPSWELRMLRLAQQWASYSTCLRKQVGAVVYHPETKAVLSIGYNDTPIGEIDCGDGGCEVCSRPAASMILDCKCAHGEGNALALAARYGHATDGCFIAVTHQPCPACRKILIQAGIKEVILNDKTSESYRRVRLTMDLFD